MWNAPKNTIPEADFAREHMRVLEEAVRSAEEFPVVGKEVLAALNYFAARTIRQGSINLLMLGMKQGRIDHMIEGLALLKKHLGWNND